MSISPFQRQHGDAMIDDIAVRWNVNKACAVRILHDVETWKRFWNWVNADVYLCDKEVCDERK